MRYLFVHVDILGFEKRAQAEAELTGHPADTIRKSWIDNAEGKLSEAKKCGYLSHFERWKGADSWILLSRDFTNLFMGLGKVLELNYPLEIIIGIIDYDGHVDSSSFSYSNEVISSIKNTETLHRNYRDWYNGKHDESPKGTFFLITNEAYDSSEPDYRRMCKSPDSSLGFYVMSRDEFDRKIGILRFLEKAQIPMGRVEYRELEKLYVKPFNYEEIKDILDKERIVFIVGDPETGKTYTALKLLLDYSDKLEPLYFSEDRKPDQWNLLRGNSSTSLEGRIIYLEDPFGKIEFERVGPLLTDVGTFIAKVKEKGCRLIVTSREKIFAELQKRRQWAEDLRTYVKAVRVYPAYDGKKLSEMLECYIEIFRPVWSQERELLETARRAAGRILRTPMSIKKLMNYSGNVASERELEQAIDRSAEETARAFAAEIKEVFNRDEYDRLVFLSLAYVMVEAKGAVNCYENVLKLLRCDSIKTNTFEGLMLENSREVEESYGRLKYIHSSYWDAFHFALRDDGKPSILSEKIFSHVLLVLSQKDGDAFYVASAIANDFEALPGAERDRLLRRLLSKKKIEWLQGLVINENFINLPSIFVKEVLLKLSEKGRAAWYVPFVVAENYDHLPNSVKQLLFKLSEDAWVAEDVSKAVTTNYDSLPHDIRLRLLTRLCEKHRAADDLGEFLAYHFKELSNDTKKLLFKLAEKGETARGAARGVAFWFHRLPKKVRNELLTILADQSEAAMWVSLTITEQFRKLPNEFSNLLLKLSQNPEAKEYLAEDVVRNFGNIEGSLRQVLVDGLKPQIQKYLELLSSADFLIGGTDESVLEFLLSQWRNFDRDLVMRVLSLMRRNLYGKERRKADSLTRSILGESKDIRSGERLF